MGVAAVCAVTVNATDQPIGKAFTVELEALSLRASALPFSGFFLTLTVRDLIYCKLGLHRLFYGEPFEKGLAFLVRFRESFA